MRFYTLAFAMALATLLSPPALAFHSGKGEITASRNPISPGESATLSWLFTASKITVTGGGLQGKVVTGKKTLVVSPRQSTRYTFDVQYMAKAAGSEQLTPHRARYSIDIVVLNHKAAGLTSYAGTPGWRISYLKGWKYDKAVVSASTIVYFQKDDDSVERMAVASMPVKDASASALAEKVKKDFYGGYDELEILSEEPITYCGVPASLITFSGNPNSHPGVRTQSMVLVLAREGRGYVVSARTHASKFSARKAILDSMLRSFSLTGGSAISLQ